MCVCVYTTIQKLKNNISEKNIILLFSKDANQASFIWPNFFVFIIWPKNKQTNKPKTNIHVVRYLFQINNVLFIFTFYRLYNLNWK